MPLFELLRKAGVEDTDFLREAVEWFVQQLMEAEVTQQIGAERHERTAARTQQPQWVSAANLGDPGGHRLDLFNVSFFPLQIYYNKHGEYFNLPNRLLNIGGPFSLLFRWQLQ